MMNAMMNTHHGLGAALNNYTTSSSLIKIVNTSIKVTHVVLTSSSKILLSFLQKFAFRVERHGGINSTTV